MSIGTSGFLFSAEAERVLGVLDYGILVVSASDGVQSHTEALFNLLEHYNVPTFIFINKCAIIYAPHILSSSETDVLPAPLGPVIPITFIFITSLFGIVPCFARILVNL